MVSMYEIKNYENEETLFLYLNCHYEEFSKEFLESGKEVLFEVKRFLRALDDRFKGKKIILVVNGVLISSLLFSNGDIMASKSMEEAKVLNNNVAEIVEVVDEVNEIEIIDFPEVVVEKVIPKVEKKVSDVSTNVTSNKAVETKKVEEEKKPVVDNRVYVTMQRSNGVIEKIELEEYIVGVVGAEMPASFGIEALKAQALIARTYALRQMSEGKILTDTVKTQVYNDIGQLKAKWGSSFNIYYNKVKSAVASTAGEYITYNGRYIDAVYHSTSNGKTEDSIFVWGNDIPYLKSVDSHWDLKASSYLRQVEKEFTQVNNLLGLYISEDSEINVLERSTSGRINKIEIDGKVFTGINLYSVLGLRSRDFDVDIINNKLVITTKGYGHGVGMSQYGAAGMAAEGYSYRQIVNHYYQGVKIVK